MDFRRLGESTGRNETASTAVIDMRAPPSSGDDDGEKTAGRTRISYGGPIGAISAALGNFSISRLYGFTASGKTTTYVSQYVQGAAARERTFFAANKRHAVNLTISQV